MATSPLDIRMARLEGVYEQMDARLGTIESRLARLEDRLGRLEDRFDVRIDTLRDELVSRMDRQFYWILSLVVTSILVPLLLRVLSP